MTRPSLRRAAAALAGALAALGLIAAASNSGGPAGVDGARLRAADAEPSGGRHERPAIHVHGQANSLCGLGLGRSSPETQKPWIWPTTL